MSDGGNRGENSERDAARETDHRGPRLSNVGSMLANPYCHSVLYYLGTCADDPVTVEELARHFAGSETGYHPSTLIEAEYRDVQQALQRAHLPRLADVDLIDFDPDRGEVRARRSSWVCLLLSLTGQLIDRIR